MLGAVAGMLAALLESLSLVYFRSMPAHGSKLLFWASCVGLLVGLGPLVGFIAGLVTATVSSTVEALAPKRVDRSRYEIWAYTLLSSPFVALLASLAFSGRKARQWAHHDLMALAAGAVMLAAVWVGAWVSSKVHDRLVQGKAGTWEAIGLFLVGLSAAAGIHYADRVVLAGLYPFFHTGLAALTVVILLGAVQVLHLRLRRLGKRPWGLVVTPMAAPAFAAILLFVAALSAHVLATRHSFRPIAFRRTVLVSEVVRLAARLHLLPSVRGIDAKTAEAVTLPPPSGPRLGDVNVVLITVDALRADRVGLYGGKGLTPNIDRIFAHGVRFDWAYTPMPQTSYAVTSLLTGSYLTSAKRIVGTKRTLADVLRQFGYKTACFFPPAVFYIDRSLFTPYEKTRYGFEYYRVMYHKTGVDDDAAGRVDDIAAFLDSWRRDVAAGKEPGGRRLFAWVHFFDPHHPYQSRKGFGPQGGSDRERYDSEVAYVDAQIGRLYEAIHAKLPNTLFVLTADHGEAFGEHDTSAHGTSLYVEQARVPLLMAGAGLPELSVEEPVSLVDVAPTILSLLELPVPATMEGTDRTADMEKGSKGVSVPVFSELVLPGKHLLAVALGQKRLIRDVSAQTMEIFDHRKDPAEEHPLDLDSDAEAKKSAARLLGFLDRWHKGLSVTTKSPVGKSDDGDKWVERLRASSTEQKRRLLRELDPKVVKKKQLPVLRRFWKGEVDPEVRHRLAILLASKGDKKVLGEVAELVARPDLPIDMLHAGAMALAAHSDARAVEPLVESLKWIPDAQRKRAILRALGRLGDVRAGPVLVEYLHKPGLSSQAALALGDLGSRGLVPALAKALQPPYQALVRQAAARSLGKLGGGTAGAALVRAVVFDPRSEVVAAALMGLLSMSNPTEVARRLKRRRRLDVRDVRDLGGQEGWTCSQRGCVPNASRALLWPAGRPGRRKPAGGASLVWIVSGADGRDDGMSAYCGDAAMSLRRFESGRISFGRCVGGPLWISMAKSGRPVELVVIRQETTRESAGRKHRGRPGHAARKRIGRHKRQR